MIDPSLVGSWKIKGAAAPFRTYSVGADGKYFIADPDRPFHFEDLGSTLVWGQIRYGLLLGSPGQLVGVWKDVRDGDEWYFRSDGGVTVHWSATEEYFGRYEVRLSDRLWYQEFRGLIETSGGSMTLDPPYLSNQTYDWTLSNGVWAWLNPSDGSVVAEFEPV